jgi:drug/metabolite transporter (DMT)-like permease
MLAPINRTMTPTEWGLILALGLLWGGSYFYNAVALTALHPLTIVAIRVAVGGALLYAIVRATGGRMPRDADTWRGFFMMGLVNNVIPFSLIAWAQSHVESGAAAILNATTPLFAVLVAHYLTHDEKISPLRVGGVIIGFGGVVIMIGPDALAGAATDVLADLALLLASVFYAYSGVYGRRFSRAGLKPLVTATGQITASTVMMVPIALIVDQPWTVWMPGAGVWAALFGLAAISTTLAYVMYYRILATAGAVNLLLVTFLVPVSAILLGALFLGERLSANHYLGMAAIALGLAAIDGRVFRGLRRANAG